MLKKSVEATVVCTLVDGIIIIFITKSTVSEQYSRAGWNFKTVIIFLSKSGAKMETVKSNLTWLMISSKFRQTQMWTKWSINLNISKRQITNHPSFRRCARELPHQIYILIYQLLNTWVKIQTGGGCSGFGSGVIICTKSAFPPLCHSHTAINHLPFKAKGNDAEKETPGALLHQATPNRANFPTVAAQLGVL